MRDHTRDRAQKARKQARDKVTDTPRPSKGEADALKREEFKRRGCHVAGCDVDDPDRLQFERADVHPRSNYDRDPRRVVCDCHARADESE